MNDQRGKTGEPGVAVERQVKQPQAARTPVRWGDSILCPLSSVQEVVDEGWRQFIETPEVSAHGIPVLNGEDWERAEREGLEMESETFWFDFTESVLGHTLFRLRAVAA